MTTLSFFSATGGELTLVSQALSRLRTRGLDITLFGRTKDQITDPELARAFAQAAARSDAICLVSTAVPLPARHGPLWSRRGKTVANPVCRCRGSTSNPPPVTMTGSWPPRTGPAGSTTAPGGVSSGC